MSTWIIIPARYASSRFPGKPLAPLRGADGVTKTLVARAHEAACQARGIDRVVIATDDDRIAEEAARIGAEWVMTPEACRNGTERCAAALDALGATPDIVVNLQGDAPLTPPWFVDALVEALRGDTTADVATPVLRCDAETLARLRADRAAGRVGGTTAVFDQSGRALYFSKEVIPYADGLTEPPLPVFHHVGVYAYRPGALSAYAALAPSPLEEREGLEQLRFLERAAGVVRCVEVDGRGRAFWELNNPTDTPLIEEMLRDLGIS